MPASDPAFDPAFLQLPARPAKPRQSGIAHVMDKGLTRAQIDGLVETAGAYVDIVKLGWGTSYVTRNLKQKLEQYRGHGIPVVCGGTFFEVVYGHGKLAQYKPWLQHFGFTHVEISDGTLDIPRDEKLALIADFARDFVVLSEVGSKDSSVEFTPEEWVQWIREEKEAGAWKVITEGREGGTSGIYTPKGEMRTDIVGDIAGAIAPADLIWEAPSKAAQAWFIKQFGPEVNLGNIPAEEVIALETLRLGLRGDTLQQFLP